MGKKNIWAALAIAGLGICALWPLPTLAKYCPGVLCAKCINQCAQDTINEALCLATGPCVGAADPLHPPVGADFFVCNDIYVKSDLAPVAYLGMCSPTPSGELMYCCDRGLSYNCGEIHICWCDYELRTCKHHDFTPTYGTDQRDCPRPELVF